MGLDQTTWSPANNDWRRFDANTSRTPLSNLDSRIASLNNAYGGYASALQNAQIDYDPFRAQIAAYYGQPGMPSMYQPAGGSWTGGTATGQYLPIQQALQGAQSYYGDQQGRFNEFYGDQQGRYEGLASQFLDMAQGVPDAEGNRTGGFYNTQYTNAIAALDALRANALSGADAQYANTLSGANSLYELGMGVMGDDGVRRGGFFADQYAGATGDALGMRNRLTGRIDPLTGMATGGLYGTQYNMDTLLNQGLYDTSTALNEALYGASTYDEDLGQWTGGAATSLANTVYDESTSFANSIYDLAGGVMDDTGTRMGGFYQDQAMSAVSAADAAYSAAAAPLETTTETRPVMDEFDQPVMEEVTTWEPMHEADGTPILDANGKPVTEPVVSMQPTTEEIVSYQGGFYSVQEANQIRRAQMAETQARQQAARVRAQQVQNATTLYDNAKQFFSNEKDAALGMLAAMEGVQVAPNASPEEIAAATGARGRYAQQMSFFGEQEQRGIAELARQIGVINAENVRRSGRVQTYEDLMRGRISEQEQALLERIGGLQSAATTEMDTVRAAETQRLADLRSGYGEDVAGAVAALQAQGIDPTQLQAMTAQTGALLGAQEASQLAMLDRLQRAEGMLGAEQELAARSMAGDARLALENQLFSARAGIEEDIYGRLEGVEQQKFGVAEGARGGQFQAGQTLSGALDELGREAYGYGSQARAGEFGARQDMQGALGAAAIGESERVFDAGQRRAAAVGSAQDMARAGIFQSGQQQAAAAAQAYAMRDAGLFNSQNAYLAALMEAEQNLAQGSSLAQMNLLQGTSQADQDLLRGTSLAQSNLLSGTTQAQMSYDQALANARDAWQLGGYQSGVNWRQTMGDAYSQQLGDYSDAYGQQLAGYADAYGQQAAGYFDSGNQYYQSMFDALEKAEAGTFNAAEAARTGVFNAEQQAASAERAVEAGRFDQMMDLYMSELTQASGLQGDLAKGDLTRDLAIMDATSKAEQAAAANVPVTQSWMAPGSATEVALTAMGMTPQQVANMDNTTLRGLVDQYWTEQRADAVYQRDHYTAYLPWDQQTYYNYPDDGMGEFRYRDDFLQELTGAGSQAAGIGLENYVESLGFSPWQDPIDYTAAQYASGDYPGTPLYEQEPTPWRPSGPQGVAFDVGFVGPGGPVVTDINALKQYAASAQMPYPDVSLMSEDERNAAISNWYTTVLEASLAPTP
jgi:hypothetical protein